MTGRLIEACVIWSEILYFSSLTEKGWDPFRLFSTL
jgi:hypothetical protein